MCNDRIFTIYDGRIITAFVEHTHINTEYVGEVYGSLHCTFIRADDHQMVFVCFQIRFCFKQSFDELVQRVEAVETIEWDRILYTRIVGIKRNEVGNTHVNEKGWVVGEGIDGRRVRVIIRGSSMPTIVSSTGEPYTLIGEQLYVGDEAIEDNYVGECWEVSDGYQFEMMRGAHKFVYDDDTKEGFSVEVSYMENGYYEAMQTYEIKETEGTYELSTWESVQKQPEMTVNNGIVVEEVEPSSIFNGLELQRLNVD